jgi:AcrR family transcriptional regulator
MHSGNKRERKVATTVTTTEGAERRPPDGDTVRGRILQAAYDLFCREGINTVGIDRIVAEAGVAKMSLYRHFRSKEELVLAVLDLREKLWRVDWLEAEVERRAPPGKARLLAVFDLFDEWFRRDDYEGCLFINTLLEVHDRGNPLHAAAAEKRARIRALLRRWAEEAGIAEPETFAWEYQMLMNGAIVAAHDTVMDLRRMRSAAASLLERRTR